MCYLPSEEDRTRSERRNSKFKQQTKVDRIVNKPAFYMKKKVTNNMLLSAIITKLFYDTIPILWGAKRDCQSLSHNVREDSKLDNDSLSNG